MEKRLLVEYQTAMASQSQNNDFDAEDIINNRMLYLLENPEKQDGYIEQGHFEKSLKWYVRKRQIRVRQQRENLISLSDTEKGTSDLPVMVSIPKDFHLYKHLLNQFNSDGSRIWTTRQMKVIAKRYLSGKTQTEIATELNVSQPAIKYIYNRIDKKILKLDLKNNVSRYYNGSGATRSDTWTVQYDTNPGPVNTDPDPLPDRPQVPVSPMPDMGDYVPPVNYTERQARRDVQINRLRRMRRNAMANMFKHNIDGVCDADPYHVDTVLNIEIVTY